MTCNDMIPGKILNPKLLVSGIKSANTPRFPGCVYSSGLGISVTPTKVCANRTRDALHPRIRENGT